MLKFNDITPIGYAQYVEIDLGIAKMIILSGQVAVDMEGNTLGKENFEQQTECIFTTIKKILEKAGGNMDNIVKLNNYLTDISNLPLFRNVRDRHINTAHPPASTAVEVSRLFRDDILLEIEATAIIDKN